MKFFVSSTDGIFVIFTCFVFVSTQRDFPSESATSNSTTEFPCNSEDGCNTTERATSINPVTSTSNTSDVTVDAEDNTTLCPENGCQTESSSPDTTEAIHSDNGTVASYEIDANDTATTVDRYNSSQAVESSTTVTTTDESETETEVTMDIVTDSSESRTTLRETNTQSLNTNDSRIIVTITPDRNDSENSSLTRTDVTQTEPTDTGNSSVTTTTYVRYVVSEIGNYSEINITTDTSSEAATEISNYTDDFASNGSFTEIFTEDIDSTPNVSSTEMPSTDANILSRNISVTTENSTREMANETTEIVFIETDVVTNEPSDVSNVTTYSDHPSTTESITNYTTVLTIDDLPTVTPYRNYLTVQIEINCSNNDQQREISSSLAEFLNTTLGDSNQCFVLRNVTLVAPNEKVEFLKISQFLMEKYNAIRLVKIWSGSRDFNGTTDTVAVADEVTEREVVLYVSLGVCLGIVLLLAVVITCFKCLRKRSNKPLDLDVPHLNLRLEDYTLTRIPRPNTVYLDYYRGPIINDRYSSAPLSNSVNSTDSERGLIQPFDTSVVPLEDAKKLEELSAPVTRNDTNCPSTPLRTFGRKDWKNGDGLIYENIMSSSTEKLHSDFFKSGNRGQDNPTFAA